MFFVRSSSDNRRSDERAGDRMRSLCARGFLAPLARRLHATLAGARAAAVRLRGATARKPSQVAASGERHTLAIRGANDGVWDWDLERGSIYLSPRFEEMLGYRENELGDRPPAWIERVHPEDRERLGREMAAHLGGVTPRFESEHRLRHRDGSWLWVLCRGLALHNEIGRATRFAGFFTDIAHHRALHEQLEHDAFHDHLTGLPNRALFLDRLGRAVERAKRHEASSFTVMALGLDRFKVVNDSLGHAVGDELLKVIAGRLVATLRPEDTVARLGGDEFAVLLEQVEDVVEATLVAERIGEELRRPLDLGGHEVFPTASVGIVVSASGFDGAADVLRDADTALDRAKAQGPGRYEVFDHSMHARAVALLQMETDLRHALERGELVLHYQPIVRVADGTTVGFEALARWNHPRRGLVSPVEFVPVAEETGLIVPFGTWAIREVCRQAREWRDRFGEAAALPISVNLSARHFAHQEIVALVRETLRSAGLPGELLEIEITESVLMDEADTVAGVLGQLKALGVELALDDFGTGYSCLSLLESFPIDTLKIDRSFVSRIGTRAGPTVRAITALAHSLEMNVVAEGVETPEQLAALRQLTCDRAQGYLFSRPLPPEAAGAFFGRSGGGAGAERRSRSADLVPVCAWCGRVRDEQGGWQAPAPGASPSPQTHGICPDCLRKQTSSSE
jgi:diguanylate cyclase (GGDEF)-like protein/PAS domain S-box-containing protein